MNTNDIIEEILKQIKQPLWENWYIRQKIGSGAFSAVFKVEAKRTSRRTSVSALKIEPITAEGTHFFDEQRKRNYIENKRRSAETEAEIMYSLRKSPYIVSYEDEDIKELYINGVFEGYYYLIRMEYLTAISTLIQTRQFDFSEKNIINLTKHIGQGIRAAHMLEIIHRDIKLDNFFVDELGTYKLGDFNISKKTGAARTFAGTPGYLAPEIYRAKSDIDAVYTSQADIYSFGICLYQLANELLFPFEDEMDLEEAIDKRMSGVELPPPKNASPEFAKIILKACEFDTDKRYQSIEELLDDVDDLPRRKSSKLSIESKNEKESAEPAQKQNEASKESYTGLELDIGLKPEPKSESENEANIENIAVDTVPAILNEDLKRDNEVAQMQYNLKSDGEFVEFGSYYVAVNNPKMPLRWRILAIEEDKALIITFMGIDVRNFNDTPGTSNWENSSIRKWLNTEFYDEAFTASEKQLIVEAELMNYKNVTYRTDNGGKTKDNVFLLSIEEAERYFQKNEDRIIKPTAYVRNKGIFIPPNGNVWWWLRSSGNTPEYAADIDYGGDVDKYGSDRFYGVNCVRPAVWISLAFLNENRRKSFKQSFMKSHNTSFISYNQSTNQVGVNAQFKSVSFGQYFYNDSYSKSPIEWYVLTIENKKALLITANGIDCLPYNENQNFTTWENSQIRKWLNNDFMVIAFNEKERKLVKSTTFNTPDNPFFNTKGGKTSTDKVFLLNVNEASKYFKSNSERMSMPTPFAKSKGLFVDDKGYSWWWLRSPGNVQSYVADVDYGGDVDYYGSSAAVGKNAIRPAMWVDIKVLDLN